MQAGVVTAVLAAYIGPVSGYLDQRSELAEQQRHLTASIAEREQARHQLDALAKRPVLEARARGLGLVKPGERLFYVSGLPPAARPAPPSPDEGGGILGWFSSRL